MNWVYLHILANHTPIILSGLGVLAAIAALISRKRVVWLYALTTLTLAGLSVYPVFFSGSQAEDTVVDHDRNARRAIHAHEEAADWALWLVLATGAVSAYTLYRLRKQREGLPPGWLQALVLITALFASTSVAKAGFDGGKIRHEEWERSLSTPPPPPSDTSKM